MKGVVFELFVVIFKFVELLFGELYFVFVGGVSVLLNVECIEV